MPTPRTSAGYSLLELLVVLAIITLISVTALPGMSGAIERLELKGSARDLAKELKTLREIALDRQEDISVTLNEGGSSTLNFSKHGNWQPAWGIEVNLERRSNRPAAAVMTIGWDGTVAGSIILSRGDERLRVRGEAVTGRILVERVP